MAKEKTRTKLNFDDLFESKETETGQRKTRFLRLGRVLCGRLPGVEPIYRFSWEMMWKIYRTSRQRTLRKMRACEYGSHFADIYASLKKFDHPTKLFLRSIALDFLPKRIADYNPDCGFDLDIFVDCTSLNVWETLVVAEVFPRKIKGQQNKAYTSRLKLIAPFVPLKEEENPGQAIITLLINDTLEQGGKADLRLGQRWLEHRGLWPFCSLWAHSLLLNRVAMSIILTHNHEQRRAIVVPSVGRDQLGKYQEAGLNFTVSPEIQVPSPNNYQTVLLREPY